ncbi:MAG: D-alanyl-D-alanine carboxypeptidase [Candidatus Zambryskibacteria bacterium]|nr:D-alanyl-D-alanine carboxypeptidase [Candidatus Zambryskibacteria bacterium]
METSEIQTDIISKRLFAFNAVVVFLIVVMLFVINSSIEKKEAKKIVSEKNSESTAFNNINLEAKSAYVYDVRESKVLFKKNEFAQFPLASITKLMMALTAVELIPRNSRVTIKKEFLSAEGDTGLLADESWTLAKLLDFSLLVSSNDGARSIASVVGAMDLRTNDYNLGRADFIAKMNAVAKKLGLKQTYFTNESGLDMGGVSGGYGSAIDVAKLMSHILKVSPEMVEATKYEFIDISSLEKVHRAENTNIYINKVPGLMASKTGYTEMAGGNLVIAFDASIGHPVVVVVLGSTIDGRFKDVEALVKASLAYIRE